MKKLIFVLTLIFAFTINVNAQDRKVTPQETAKKEAAQLAEIVGLTDVQTQDFYRLLEMKYQTLQDTELSVERKAEFLNVVSMKISGSLTEAQLKKLEANPEFFDRLKNGEKTK